MKKLIWIILFAPLAFFSCDEPPVEPDTKVEEKAEVMFTFNHQFEGEDITYSEGIYTLPDGSSIKISRIAYILSKFYLIKEDGSKLHMDGQYAFLNPKFGVTEFTLKDVPKGSYKGIGFSLGLDSAINHGDPNQYPVDHPLSSVNNSLHWSWFGGYIFLALEGQLSDGSENFIFHLAGSQNVTDYELMQNFTKGDKALNSEITLNYEEIFKNPEIYDLEKDGMSTHTTDGPVTQKLFKNCVDIFELGAFTE